MFVFTSRYPMLSAVLKNEVQVAPTPITGTPIFKQKYIGLWDTGATSSVITQKIVDELNLKEVHYGQVYTVSGVDIVPFFYVDISLPNGVIIPKLLAPLGRPSECDLLIGMDIIGRGDFAVSNYDGKTTFTYRYPSIMEFDFVTNTYQKPIEKTGIQMSRNSICNCGSGKKYKNCHGKA